MESQSEYSVIHHPGLGIDIAVSSDRVHPAIVTGIREGWYEADEAFASRDIICTGDRVLELGGGLGAVAAFNVKTSNVSVYAIYEADLNLIPLIRGTLRLNDCHNCQIHNSAVLSSGSISPSGFADFYLHREFWASSITPRSTDQRRVSVPAVSFSSALSEFSPTVIICDIEGSEIELFQDERMPSVRDIVVELHPDVTSPSEIARFLETCRSLGFRLRQNYPRNDTYSFTRASS